MADQLRANRATLATRARRKRVADELARLESELEAHLSTLKVDRDIAPKAASRDLADAVALIRKVRQKIADVTR